jgi:hypothetical protein
VSSFHPANFAPKHFPFCEHLRPKAGQERTEILYISDELLAEE